MQESYAQHDYGRVARALPVPDGAQIVDAGGGTGALAGLLLELHPGCRATVLERPEVAALVRRRPGLTAQAGDLFARWPVRGDVIVLARVLHDHDDADALAILRRAHAALDPDGQLAVVEMLLSDDPGDHGGGLCDLHLAAVCGGRERSYQQVRALLRAAGFARVEHIPIDGIAQIVMAHAR